MSLSDLLTFETNPNGGVNLTLLANGDSSIVFPTCQDPVVQNKNCFAPYNQSLVAAMEVSYAPKSYPALFWNLPKPFRKLNKLCAVVYSVS